MNIPVELFLGFMALSIVFIIMGVVKKSPALIVTSGMFILTMGVLPDGIIMGKIPTESTVTGATTTYEFIDNVFTYTQVTKMMFGLLGAFIMFVGALMVRD